MTYTAGHGTFTRHYTSRGYLSEIRQGSSVLERISQHDAFGRPKVIQYANALSTQYEHDSVGRINRIVTGTASAPRITQDLEYEWRSNGILKLRRDRNNGAATWTETFGYDNLDRLTSATTSGGPTRSLGFAYDSTGFGNLLTKTSNVSGDLNVTNHADGSAHRLSGATIRGIYTSFSYDPAGNITQYTPSTGASTYIGYNGAGQVSAITVGAPSSPTARDEFWYTPDGERFLKRTTWQENGITRTGWALYLLGGAFEQLRIVGDSAVSYRSQVQVTGTVLHRRTQPVSGSASAAFEYRYRDHLGSTDVITNSSGAIISSLAADPFGARRDPNWAADLSSSALSSLLANSQSPVQRGFTGHEHLDRTGFIHMNGRVYDPRIGRFIQPDPIVQAPGFSQSYNRYAYTFNSPLSFTDPSGFQSAADRYGGGCCEFSLSFSWVRTEARPQQRYEISDAEIMGAYIHQRWRDETVPRLRSEHRVVGGGGSTVGGMFADDAITADEPDQRLGRLTGHIRVSAVPNHGMLITITGALTFDATVTNDQALAYLNAIHEAWNTGEKYKGVRYAVRTSLELNGRVSMFNPRGAFHLTDCASRCGPSAAYGASIPLRGLLMRSGIELDGTEAHEFGHVLGLDHRTRTNLSIMNSHWDVPGRRVSGYDLYRLEQLYGR